VAGAEAATQSKQTETKTRPRTSTPEVAGMGTVALPYVPSGPLANLPNARMRQEAILNLQRWGGNAMVQRLLQREGDPEEELPPPAPVPPTHVDLEPTQVEGLNEGGDGEAEAGREIKLEGKTDATFNKGGTGDTSDMKTEPGKGCAGCPPENCVHVSGTLIVNYHVDTKITMPGMPDGLSPCEQGKVTDFLENKLMPHEQEHVAEFEQYNGTTERQYSFTACRGKVDAKIAAMVKEEADKREETVQAASDKLDPYKEQIDFSSCYEEEEGEEEEVAP
jgi:hypothetical protein